VKVTAKRMRTILNLYPPYLGAGIHVDNITEDWRQIDVSMQLRWYNRNVVRTHFGGSLYSMVDPHLMLMLMQLLGEKYIVWDKSAEIDFIRPGKGKVFATLKISDEDLKNIYDGVERRGKFLPKFEVKIVDKVGKTVCRIIKTLYIRKKRE